MLAQNRTNNSLTSFYMISLFLIFVKERSYMKKSKWFEREEKQRITPDWVRMNCKLTSREMKLLKIIYDRKLVRRDHLEVISEDYRYLGDNRSIIMSRSIKRMYRKMCIDKAYEPREYGKGYSPCIVTLDRAGSILLNVAHKRRLAHKKSLVNGREIIIRTLPINYKHINGINRLEVETILFCDKTNNILKTWEHEVSKKFHYGMEEVHVIPDVFTEMHIHGKKILAFIEFDTGSENIRRKLNFPIINDKLIKYRKYKLSKLWTDECEYFPIILFVTEDERRISYFNKKCKEHGLQGFGIWHENYGDFLAHLGNIV